MRKSHENIWRLAVPYLQKGIMKDFVIHTKGVIKAMKILLKKESGDRDTLIPAAILHDVGWYKVPQKLQKSRNRKVKLKALRLHLKHASPVIEKILKNVNYDENKIGKIIDVVLAHKFCKPTEQDKKLLIDADCLADAFKDQFHSDIKSYNTTPEDMYKIRKNNKFYTRTARKVFNQEMKKRKQEFSCSL